LAAKGFAQDEPIGSGYVVRKDTRGNWGGVGGINKGGKMEIYGENRFADLLRDKSGGALTQFSKFVNNTYERDVTDPNDMKTALEKVFVGMNDEQISAWAGIKMLTNPDGTKSPSEPEKGSLAEKWYAMRTQLENNGNIATRNGRLRVVADGGLNADQLAIAIAGVELDNFNNKAEFNTQSIKERERMLMEKDKESRKVDSLTAVSQGKVFDQNAWLSRKKK
jgi:hypothetical protein